MAKINYEEYTKDDLIRLIRERDRKPKFGLVWERDEIDHDKSLNDDFVVLDHDTNLSVGEAPHQNLIIEGDNFDALRYLKMTHSGKVKCIYIDPPYNTGNKDFIYNDHFLDKDDAFRHSKWLEFMYRRLTLAKNLLAEDGVIFVSIGEEEYSHLSVLMDQILPGMKVGTFVWRRRSGASDAKEWFVSVDHEYVLCYANPGFSFAGTVKDASSYKNPDNDPRGGWDSGDLAQGKNFKQRPDAFYPIYSPVTDTWYPCDPDNAWRFATEERLEGKKIRSKSMEQIIREERVLWPKNDTPIVYSSEAEIVSAILDETAPKNLRMYATLDELKTQCENGHAPAKLLDNILPLSFWVGKKIGYGKPRYKRFANELKRTEKPISTWVLPSSIKREDLELIEAEEVKLITTGFTSEGTALLSQMIGNKDFPYPKPLSLIKELIGQATDAESGHIVLDFFAGSGTTGHAVLDLNKEDDGDRTFILVSATEATVNEPKKNVCQNVTAKRLKSAISGYSYRTPKGSISVPGIGGSFAYLRTKRIPANQVFHDIKHDQIWLALQLIHLNSITIYDEADNVQISGGNNVEVAYIPKVTEDSMAKIRAIADKTSTDLTVYSWQPGLLQQYICNPNISFETIPQYLIDRFSVGAAR